MKNQVTTWEIWSKLRGEKKREKNLIKCDTVACFVASLIFIIQHTHQSKDKETKAGAIY